MISDLLDLMKKQTHTNAHKQTQTHANTHIHTDTQTPTNARTHALRAMVKIHTDATKTKIPNTQPNTTPQFSFKQKTNNNPAAFRTVYTAI